MECVSYILCLARCGLAGIWFKLTIANV